MQEEMERSKRLMSLNELSGISRYNLEPPKKPTNPNYPEPNYGIEGRRGELIAYDIDD